MTILLCLLLYGGVPPVLMAKGFDLDPGQDPVEFCFERGWTDGLPVVPPTEERVLRMLAGAKRAPGERLAWNPPLWRHQAVV